MFLGEFEHTTDPKHRVVLPSPLRREVELQRGFVLVPEEKNECLELHPFEAWERRVADLEKDHDVHRDRTARAYFRRYIGRAQRGQCDNQGRFLLPEVLRRAVGIDRDVRFIGMVHFIEIWSAERWRDGESVRDAEGAEGD